MAIRKKEETKDRDALIEEAIALVQTASDEIILAALKAALEAE